jgi:hypothetical protein
MDWTHWLAHFERNATRPLPAGPIAQDVDEAVRIPLAKSIAIFQLGEAGAGRLAHEIDGVRFAHTDARYTACIKHFVREEGRHARILGFILRGLDGTFLKRAWANSLFTFGRRLLGVRFKLLVALVAEVIGLGFYGMVAEHLGPGAVRAALEQICGDEAAHLEFHAEFFATQLDAAWKRLAFRAVWWSVGLAAVAVVLRDHAPALRALDISRREAFRRFHALLVRAEAAALTARRRQPCAAPTAA